MPKNGGAQVLSDLVFYGWVLKKAFEEFNLA